MALDAKHFDKLRKKAIDLTNPPFGDGHQAISLTRHLFMEVINDMEKLSNLITETKIDITKHDKNGRVKL